MPLPIAHALVGAGIVVALRDDFSLRRDWWTMMLGATLAVAPDFDLFFTWVLNPGLKVHGGMTHSIVFALALGSAVSLLFRESTVRGALGYLAAVLSHSLLDTATKKEFGGSQLLWPLSNHKYKLGIFSDYEFYPNPGHQPISEILQQSLIISGYELMVYLPPLLIVLGLRHFGRLKTENRPWRPF
jgi:membrane-bound metal-dependent hydrolase YbcI (DUF457 family)